MHWGHQFDTQILNLDQQYGIERYHLSRHHSLWVVYKRIKSRVTASCSCTFCIIQSSFENIWPLLTRLDYKKSLAADFYCPTSNQHLNNGFLQFHILDITFLGMLWLGFTCHRQGFGTPCMCPQLEKHNKLPSVYLKNVGNFAGECSVSTAPLQGSYLFF